MLATPPAKSGEMHGEAAKGNHTRPELPHWEIALSSGAAAIWDMWSGCPQGISVILPGFQAEHAGTEIVWVTRGIRNGQSRNSSLSGHMKSLS